MLLDFETTKFDSLVPLSGGIDSTAALYKVLKENPTKNYLIFRVDMVHGTSGHRTTREAMAADKILKWLYQNGFKNFCFREVRIDYSSLGMMPPVWDSEVINFFGAMLIQGKPEISEFIDGAIKDDFKDPDFQNRLDKIAKILYIHTGKSREELKIDFPIKHLSKYEVIQSIPQELLSLTWSCRYPIIVAPWTFGRCHDCPQCKLIDNVLESNPDIDPMLFSS
jgi:7-cyano-7-deazaguanine synthase in queuosine biosynthesis